MLITKAEEVMSDRKSLVMLVGRLLMSTLFLYVGVTEVRSSLLHFTLARVPYSHIYTCATYHFRCYPHHPHF